MAVLLFQTVVLFVGAGLALRKTLWVCWALSLALAIASLFVPVWWAILAILKVLSSQLAQDGIDALEAQSGEQALAVLDSRPIDVVVSGLRMPGMDGIALLGRIAQSWPEVPVIILTAHGSIQLAVETMKLGAAGGRRKRAARPTSVARQCAPARKLRGAPDRAVRRPPRCYAPTSSAS